MVLIASGESEYENAVILVVEEKLKDEGILIKKINISQIDLEYPKDFDAILLMHAVAEDTLKPGVQSFLKRTPAGEKGPWKEVMVSTVTGRDWIGKNSNVDGISSATPVSQARNVATLLLGRIHSILEGKF